MPLRGHFFVKKTLLLASTLLCIGGCEQLEIPNNKESEAGTNSSEKIRRVEASTLENEIKVNITGGDPERYVVQFSWPYLEDGKILRIRLGSVLAEVLPNQTFFTHILPHNQTVTFSFDVLDKNRKLDRTFTKTVRVPADFVANAETSQINETSKIEVHRLYLNGGFPLTTNGHTVDIIANEIHAERGYIQTFPEKIKTKSSSTTFGEESPPTAEPEKDGRSGGNISITSKKLFGRLRVYMRGENGGAGPKGDPTDNRMEGTGIPAGHGKLTCRLDPNDNCAARPERCLVDPTPVITRRECICSSYGSKAGDGIPGTKGKPGKPGMTGGDTGNIRISIHEYVPAEGFDPTLPNEGGEVVQVFQVPGKGGRGGIGGGGQRGSIGGPGRDPNNREDCRGDSGGEGKIGDPGESGPPGTNGNLGLKCIYVGSENINECIQ